jgi:hypothetical protein
MRRKVKRVKGLKKGKETPNERCEAPREKSVEKLRVEELKRRR